MANPFKDWTPQMIAEHNRRVLGPKGVVLPKRVSDALTPTPKRKPLLNKTEARFLARLKAECPDTYIGCQNITFRLGHDLRYTPDFWMAPVENGDHMTFWEVKGPFIREDSIVKLKTAASMFKMFEFILAQWKDGKWTTKTIPPI